MTGSSPDTDSHSHSHREPHPHSHRQPELGTGAQALNPWMEERLWRLGGDGLVLDLGCGRGYWMRRMSDAGLQPVGIEPDFDRVRLAAPFGPVAAAGGGGLPMADGSIGLVWCIHVLHHLEDPDRVLAEVRRVLRPGGHFVLAETVEDNPLISLGRRVWPHWDGVDIQSRFTAAGLMSRLETAGLDVVERRQHSLVSFAAWALPAGGRRAWAGLTRLESWLPEGLNRWGAHVECVARRPD